MNDMIENRMVLDRAWPLVKPQSRDERIDELTRDGLFREWDWLDDEAAREIAVAAVGAYREAIPDNERMAKVKETIEAVVEAWAETEADDED